MKEGGKTTIYFYSIKIQDFKGKEKNTLIPDKDYFHELSYIGCLLIG